MPTGVYKRKPLTEQHKEHIKQSMLKAHEEGRHNNGFQEGTEPFNKGKHHLSGIPRHAYDNEFKNKISKSKIGHIPWNKGDKKHTYEEQRRLRNEYQSIYRNTIGNLKYKIHKINRRFLEKQFIHSFT
jgi:hypothetical protein